MWQLYPVPFWRQIVEWWHGRPGEPVVMRRRIDGRWQMLSLTAEEHARRRRLGLC